MKHARRLFGLLAVASVAALAFAAGVGATTITSSTGTIATPTIHAESEGGHVTFKSALITFSCASTFEAKVESHLPKAPATVTSFMLTGCTNSWHFTTLAPGTFEIKWTSGYNATLYWTGAKIESTRFGLRCVYITKETAFGTVTGGSPATFDISANIPTDPESGASCGTGTTAWSGSYIFTSSFYLDQG